jgi:hypothetical protein
MEFSIIKIDLYYTSYYRNGIKIELLHSEIQLIGSHSEVTNIDITDRWLIKFPETFRNYDKD